MDGLPQHGGSMVIVSVLLRLLLVFSFCGVKMLAFSASITRWFVPQMATRGRARINLHRRQEIIHENITINNYCVFN